MNADIPYLHCWVRRSFISGSVGMEEAFAFAIQSYPGRALAFHVMLKSGAHYRGVPIHAIAVDRNAPEPNLGDCQLWDCFTFHPIVHVYQYLRDHEAVCLTRSGPVDGTYLFTVDWLPDHQGPGFTHIPDQNKCGHVLALANGNLCCLPTNRLAWKDGYFIGASPAPQAEGYRVQAEVYQAEDSAWDASRGDRMFYDAQTGAGTAGDTPK